MAICHRALFINDMELNRSEFKIYKFKFIRFIYMHQRMVAYGGKKIGLKIKRKI